MAGRRLFPVLTLIVLSAALLAACGSSSGDSTTTASSGTGTTATGGSCSTAAITKAVKAAGKAQGTTATLIAHNFKCADGWAYADVSMGPENNQVDVTLVFKRDGEEWVAADRTTACKAPGDQVPESLFKLACESN